MRKLLIIALWALASVCVITLVTLPISLETQLVTGLCVLFAMMVLKLIRPDGIWRLVALAFGTAIVMRYVYWRTTSTLPPINQLENFIPGFLLYLAEMYSVMMLALSLFVVALPLPSRPSRANMNDRLPQVDVFIPTYNEDPDLLANTMAAARGMDYPADKVRVWLLDDGGTLQKRNSEKIGDANIAERRYAQLKKLSAELGVTYLTRDRNEHAKAGNLNNGLAHSTGELIAVFDADHAPARDFLKETVGYFDEDPRLFLVQTPHFFLNPDPVERNLRTFEKMPSENEMFYGIIQRGLDKWNASFFCGSAAVLRRAALAETNGFSGVSITEDCETAIELHSRGWHSVYVDKPLIAGLQPATFASFIGQRSRWAQGMMQILRFRFPPFKRGLSIPQRLCYMSSTLFWLFPFPRTIFLVAPLFYLFFDLQIFTASGGEFMAYTLTYMVVNLMMQNYLYGAFRWPWVSELYEYVQTVHLLPAVISVILNPRKPTFKVTAKDESIATSRLSEIGKPFFAIFGILLVGVFVTVWKVYAEPFKADVTLVVGGWNLINLIMAGCALGVVSERGERAATRRVKVSRRCDFEIGGRWLQGTIENVSANGARVLVFGANLEELAKDATAGIRFKLFADGTEAVLPVVIRNFERTTDSIAVGCLYQPTEAVHHRLVADLIFANSKQWEQFQLSRRGNPGLLRGTAWFLRLAIFQTYRGLVYFWRDLRGRTGGEPVATLAEKRQ
ncbi:MULTISPECIES: UDP-forming cellulose synthase catalytic subunit [Mesorhizobium]|uniref:Cellulose synthase catalytic subunit [UDP-forming] n=1 Tax=Rhizobium loti TaxID=381 RepID=A0A6M7U133_RHILI|nr:MULTISPECIES: UDP-forming cellulose synthase catalytic subunit [Mesorhizobium]KRB31225.1 cellulose synthase [Mesorhizobium sp. Root172]OBQ60978.1 cellulose synthase catalytic subunit (UDP-forming) [Mesorhizobium loti]QKC70058.1 UDP-forming cellulose synthase catalytic subunit [Mesorhizobium loti]QKC92058.1 UDP-forming cellulose synthase catalytic subunit [Mesorhizobium sp. NZP2234]